MSVFASPVTSSDRSVMILIFLESVESQLVCGYPISISIDLYLECVFRSGLIYTLLVRLVFCFGKHGSYHQLAAFPLSRTHE